MLESAYKWRCVKTRLRTVNLVPLKARLKRGNPNPRRKEAKKRRGNK
jgi:hypothetical protein